LANAADLFGLKVPLAFGIDNQGFSQVVELHKFHSSHPTFFLTPNLGGQKETFLRVSGRHHRPLIFQTAPIGRL